MIEFRQVSKHFGAQEVLNAVSFQLNPGERVGIVGPNGAGKSTVFELITGETSPDQGEVALARDLRIGHVRQQLAGRLSAQSLLAYTENADAAIAQMEKELDEISHRLGAAPEPEKAGLMHRLGELQTRYEHAGGYDLRNRAEAALCGLGFPVQALAQPFASFSGGWQMRAELARILIARPDTLLLDEPSNYLDLPAVEWLQKFLRDFSGTLLLISHDRFLLNSLTAKTLEIAGTCATLYGGPYEYYVRERRLRHEQLAATRKNQDRRREQIERFIERFRAKNTKASQVQSRIKMLEKMEEVPEAGPALAATAARIRLAPPPHSGHEVVRLEDAGFTYDGQRWILRNVNMQIARGEKIALVGYNGMGKTTLLRLLAGQLPPNEGRHQLGHKVVTGYQAQDSAETMNPQWTVFETIKSVAANAQEREVRTLLGGFGFSGESVEKKVAVLSGGEKIRLAFARLLIRPPNFLLLDEPTTHLDIAAREALEDALKEFEGTLCFVSHDIAFVRRVADAVIAMDPPGIIRYAGGYDYYCERKAAAGASPQVQPTGEKAGERKQQRRARAEWVQAYARKRRPLEQAMAAAEKQIGDLEAEQAELLDQLSTSAPALNFAQINQRLSAIQQELAQATATWEQSGLALEALAREWDSPA